MSDYEVLGRQPATVQISPSKPYDWYGRAGEGDRYTSEQLSELAKLDLDPEQVDGVTARRAATTRELWWGIGQMGPVFEFDCPIIARRRDGKLQVISPSGTRKIIPADGWVSPRPTIKKGSMFA